MPRKEYTIHYIYKTTNIVNGKFYVGMHSTFNSNDNYIGSGTYLWIAIRKYGRENFVKEILEFLPDRSSLKSREKEIVNKEFLQNPLCMNLKPGGEGGFNNDEHQLKCAIAGGKAFGEKFKNDPQFQEKISKSVARINSERLAKNNTFSLNWAGRTHRPETIEKMSKSCSIAQTGDKNSQFGSRWINNGIQARKIKKDDPIPEGWKKGRSLKTTNIGRMLP